ncbi:hypothetical protein LSH36_30g08054 [Paralvinella palmiformis]|uniref:Uncharacterized protein n=1 Tax=Paralvinella palmiformis TaxID=53620 RepID=A0AAD9NGD1_9ANNE|nr:hypothetical protein LSH36_30g08054 [Paralvinella palmiformis]
MECKPLASNIKHPVHIRVGDQKSEFYSGCSVIDVTFPNVFYVEVQEIHFKNYYTYSVSVLAKQKDTSSNEEPKWKVAVKDMCIMPNAHSDHGSENYVTITQKQVTSDAKFSSLLADGKQEKDQEVDDGLLKNHGIKSVNVLSRDLQSLWALTEQSYINQTNISLGRYDVEGSYEINLLSYT